MKPLRLALVAAALAVPLPAHALFHLAVIDEVMTSYDGDDTVQFVEIKMLAGSQVFTTNSILSVFAADGAFVDELLILPGDVTTGGADRHWIMGTTAFETVFGHQVDFEFPAGLLTGSGMVCWGAPPDVFSVPPPASWDHSVPNSYVDCLAYGNYTGPTNNHIGAPNALSPDGHSLRRVSETDDNSVDFTCGDPADPVNNADQTASLPPTTPCPEAPAPLAAAAGAGVLAMARRLRSRANR